MQAAPKETRSVARYVAGVRLWRDDGNDANRQRCDRVRVTQSMRPGRRARRDAW